MSIKDGVRQMLLMRRQYLIYRFYSRQFHRYLKDRGFSEAAADGEQEYIKKWSQLSSRIEPWSYRFFRHYIGDTPCIVPEDIGHTVIEAKLNNSRYSDFYSDKNLYPTYIPDSAVPKTLICRIDGSVLLDEHFLPIKGSVYEALNGYNKVILKRHTCKLPWKATQRFCIAGT